MAKIESKQLVIGVNEEDIVAAFLPHLMSKLEDLLKDLRLPEQYLTRKEAAKLLNISLPTLQKYTEAGYIDKHRLGESNTARYKLSDIEWAFKKINYKKS